jgi:regulator of sirC expression with transglutaminase-like and TPR domain
MAFDPRAALLTAVAQPDGDVAEAALWLAVEDDPDVDPAPWLALLDEIAGELGPRLGTGAPPAGIAPVIAATVRDRLRLRGADGSDPAHHYLNSILERGAGNPIGCSTVWIALGRRAGLPVEGVGLPGHFVVRVAGTLIDAHDGGAPFDLDDARQLVTRATGIDAPPDLGPWLAPTGVRELVARMSRNLRALHATRQQWALALRAADRCVALLPDAPVELRERGTLRLRLGLTGGALRDLRRYLDGVPDDVPDRARVERAYASARGMLN